MDLKLIALSRYRCDALGGPAQIGDFRGNFMNCFCSLLLVVS